MPRLKIVQPGASSRGKNPLPPAPALATSDNYPLHPGPLEFITGQRRPALAYLNIRRQSPSPSLREYVGCSLLADLRPRPNRRTHYNPEPAQDAFSRLFLVLVWGLPLPSPPKNPGWPGRGGVTSLWVLALK